MDVSAYQIYRAGKLDYLKPLKMSWEEKIRLSEEIDKKSKEEEEISFKVNIPDQEVRQWVNDNHDKMGQILGNFIVGIYKASKIIRE